MTHLVRNLRVGRLPLFAFAMAGLLAGHGLSYVVAVPDPHHRDLLLERTGHAYLPTAGRIALILLLAAIASVAGRALVTRTTPRPTSLGTLALRLAAVQIVAFTGLEVLERVLSGAPLGGLVGDHLLLVGIAVQISVAVAGASILRWVIRAASRLAEIPRHSIRLLRPAPALLLPVVPALPHGTFARRIPSVRAPPSA